MERKRRGGSGCRVGKERAGREQGK